MRKLKFLMILLVVIGFTTTFTSCGGDDSPSEQQETDQYTVTVDGVELTDGETWVTTAAGEEGNMKLSIKNISDEVIYLRNKVTSLQATSLEEIELCIGSCYTGIAENAVYPTDVPYSLQPGETSPDGAVHVKNNDNRNGDVIIGLKLYQTDEQGNELTNKKSVSYTYKYDAP